MFNYSAYWQSAGFPGCVWKCVCVHCVLNNSIIWKYFYFHFWPLITAYTHNYNNSFAWQWEQAQLRLCSCQLWQSVCTQRVLPGTTFMHRDGTHALFAQLIKWVRRWSCLSCSLSIGVDGFTFLHCYTYFMGSLVSGAVSGPRALVWLSLS